MRALKWGLAAAVCVGLAVYLHIEPVGYNTACFQPMREARNFCHLQMSVMSLYAKLEWLQYADPHYLERNEDRIVRDYQRRLASGAVPDMGLSPFELRHMIQNIVRTKLGQPI